MLSTQELLFHGDDGGRLIVDLTHGDEVAQRAGENGPCPGERSFRQRLDARCRAFRRDDAFHRHTHRALFGAAESYQDGCDIGPSDRAQRLQIAGDLLSHRRQRAVAQRGETRFRGLERDDRGFDIAIEHQTALRQLDEEHRFRSRPCALGTAGATLQVIDDRAQLLQLPAGFGKLAFQRLLILTIPLGQGGEVLTQCVALGLQHDHRILHLIEAVARRIEAQQRVDARGQREHGHRRGESAVRMRALCGRGLARKSGGPRNLRTVVGHVRRWECSDACIS
jgi:hypothetical protein